MTSFGAFSGDHRGDLVSPRWFHGRPGVDQDVRDADLAAQHGHHVVSHVRGHDDAQVQHRRQLTGVGPPPDLVGDNSPLSVASTQIFVIDSHASELSPRTATSIGRLSVNFEQNAVGLSECFVDVKSRRDFIEQRVRAAREITYAELATEFDVSEMTIRRDVEALEASGVVRRGGRWCDRPAGQGHRAVVRHTHGRCRAGEDPHRRCRRRSDRRVNETLILDSGSTRSGRGELATRDVDSV